MMIAIPLFVLLLSKINCHQMPTNRHPGILQTSYEESVHKQDIPRPSLPQLPFALDNVPHSPSMQPQPEFVRRSELSSTSQLSPREILANLRSRPSSPLSSPNTRAEFEESMGNYKRMVEFQPHTTFNPQTGPFSGVNSLLRENGAGIPNIQGLIGHTPQLYPQEFSLPRAETRSMFPSEFASNKHERESAFKNPLAEELGTNLARNAADKQTLRSINSYGFQNSNFDQKNAQSPVDPILTGQGTLDPFLSSLTASLPSPVISSTSKSPRLTIPSPLSLMDSTQPYTYDVPAHTFGISEPMLTSPVGCLELTVTPYGTISETPLPDPSIPLPRSPFLPVASPVSALAPPFSPLLPSATPSAKNNSFLTKVPVPPPFL